MGEQQEALIRGVFEMLDEDGTGQVAVAQLGSVFQRLGIAGAQSAIDNVLRRSGSWITCDSRSYCDQVSFTEFRRLYEAVMMRNHNMISDDGGQYSLAAEDVIIGADVDKKMEEDVRAAFGLFDLDSNGLICAEELHAVLSAMGVIRTRDLQSCRSMIARADRNGDGHVDYDEFKHLLAAGGAAVPGLFN